MNIYEVYNPGLNNGKDSLCIRTNEIWNQLGKKNRDLQKAKKINNWDQRNKLYYRHDGYRAPIKLSTLPAPIVSQKFKDKLEKDLGINKNKEQVQFLPIPIVDYKYKDKVNGKTLKEMKEMELDIIGNYYVLNILNMLDEKIINQEKSKKDPWTYEKVVLRKKYLKGNDIFRIETYNVTYFVNGKVLKLIKELDPKKSVNKIDIELE